MGICSRTCVPAASLAILYSLMKLGLPEPQCCLLYCVLVVDDNRHVSFRRVRDKYNNKAELRLFDVTITKIASPWTIRQPKRKMFNFLSYAWHPATFSVVLIQPFRIVSAVSVILSSCSKSLKLPLTRHFSPPIVTVFLL